MTQNLACSRKRETMTDQTDQSTSLVALRGRVVTPDTVIDDGAVAWDRDTIIWVGDAAAQEAPSSIREQLNDLKPSDDIIIPGLVDVHCHGGGGESFPNAQTPEQAMTAVTEHRAHGTTSLVASLVTADAQTLKERAAMLATLADRGELAGIHFEGPFVSHERCGAQDPQFICDPDPVLTAELLDVAGGHAVTMTVAPEKPHASGEGSVAEVLREGGALPSWGHTDAEPDDVRAVFEDARGRYADQLKDPDHTRPLATVTHLFNGMKPMHHRDPGSIAEFLAAGARGDAVVEMICDGVHVNPTLVRCVYEVLGRSRCVFITDAMAAAGMADGSYQLGPQAVTVTDGIARLTDGGAIAGGTAHLLDCVRVAAGAGIPLVDAVFMASAQGARILGDETVGALEVGKRADVVCLDSELHPLRVWRAGVVCDRNK